MPAFAPLLRPVFVCRLIDLPVAFAAAALGVPGGEEEVDADVVVGIEVDADEDVVAAARDADHVVAERSDLQYFSKSAYPLCDSPMSCKLKVCCALGGGGGLKKPYSTLTRKFPLLELLAVPMRGPFVSFRFK